jgi:hypothetical protein
VFECWQEHGDAVSIHTLSDADLTCDVTIGDGGNREEVANTWFAQPEWSVARESSFGFGTFEVTNATTAVWTWRRNPEGLFEFPGQNPFPVEPSYSIADQYDLDRTGCR